MKIILLWNLPPPPSPLPFIWKCQADGPKGLAFTTLEMKERRCGGGFLHPVLHAGGQAEGADSTGRRNVPERKRDRGVGGSHRTDLLGEQWKEKSGARRKGRVGPEEAVD